VVCRGGCVAAVTGLSDREIEHALDVDAIRYTNIQQSRYTAVATDRGGRATVGRRAGDRRPAITATTARQDRHRARLERQLAGVQHAELSALAAVAATRVGTRRHVASRAAISTPLASDGE